ncbi:cysteine protease inhibitor [Striga asiatica]|uniref:Cysteine protease inhibitor n=1 Tax=Striga asiatica TaxID=4170 RepID=A0A5A7PKC7_STRAF|nr:cysteine protease inhibitor [Striga asiatica]
MVAGMSGIVSLAGINPIEKSTKHSGYGVYISRRTVDRRRQRRGGGSSVTQPLTVTCFRGSATQLVAADGGCLRDVGSRDCRRRRRLECRGRGYGRWSAAAGAGGSRWWSEHGIQAKVWVKSWMQFKEVHELSMFVTPAKFSLLADDQSKETQ